MQVHGHEENDGRTAPVPAAVAAPVELVAADAANVVDVAAGQRAGQVRRVARFACHGLYYYRQPKQSIAAAAVVAAAAETAVAAANDVDAADVLALVPEPSNNVNVADVVVVAAAVGADDVAELEQPVALEAYEDAARRWGVAFAWASMTLITALALVRVVASFVTSDAKENDAMMGVGCQDCQMIPVRAVLGYQMGSERRFDSAEQ